MQDRDTYYVEQSYKALEQALEQSKGKDRLTVVRAMKAAYPFGERKGRPYKVWNRLFNHARQMYDEGKVVYDSDSQVS